MQLVPELLVVAPQARRKTQRPSSPAMSRTFRLAALALWYCRTSILTFRIHSSSSHEPVSGAVDSKEKSWLLRIGLEFLAQAHQVGVHCARGGITLIAPDLFEQAIAAEDLARMADEILQQLE